VTGKIASRKTGSSEAPYAAEARARPESAASDDMLVSVVDLHKHFGSLEVLKGVDLDVPRGSVVTVIGRSGSGKSTMLRCINHLERPTKGAVLVDGEVIGYRVRHGKLRELPSRDVARQRAEIGMVFQSYQLFPHMTVMENLLEAPRRVLSVSKDEAVSRAEAALSQVGLLEKSRSYPSSLSGGQQQRVAIARALVMRPKLMLFDEPTSALDPELVGDVLGVMRQLADGGMTMIVVTHEMSFAEGVSDEVVFMDGGKIVERGPSRELLRNPREGATRAFLSHVM
jgi:polar amino acid transport system ATP-binding protein